MDTRAAAERARRPGAKAPERTLRREQRSAGATTPAELNLGRRAWAINRQWAPWDRLYPSANTSVNAESGSAQADAAIALRNDGKLDEAEKLFQQAIGQSPRAWKPHREYAELHRQRNALGAATGTLHRLRRALMTWTDQ